MASRQIQEQALEILNDMLPDGIDADLGGMPSGIRIDSTGYDYGGIEVVRPIGTKIMRETGHAITGIREEKGYTYIWLDPILEQDVDLTVAQEVAAIIREHQDTTVHPNINGDPQRQYVEVDGEVRAETFSAIRDAGFEVYRFSGNKIWFIPKE